jgi:hypothetical protein
MHRDRSNKDCAMLNWRCRVAVYGAVLALFALAAGVAMSERSHYGASAGQRDITVSAAGMAHGQSAGSTLVPLY